MRISDWSSDVCSSDLRLAIANQCQRFEQRARQPRRLLLIQARYPFGVISAHLDAPTAGDFAQLGGACFEIFRQPRERVANVLLGHAKIVAEHALQLLGRQWLFRGEQQCFEDAIELRDTRIGGVLDVEVDLAVGLFVHASTPSSSSTAGARGRAAITISGAYGLSCSIRSEERRVGTECVSTGRFWGAPV